MKGSVREIRAGRHLDALTRPLPPIMSPVSLRRWR